MAFGRISIIGDAAFVARPHVAAGVSKAAKDAVALAEALGSGSDDVAAALRRFEAHPAAAQHPHHRARPPSRRLPAGDADRGGTRACPSGTEFRRPFMAETAVLDFLYA